MDELKPVETRSDAPYPIATDALPERLANYFLSKIKNPTLKLVRDPNYAEGSVRYYRTPVLGVSPYHSSEIPMWQIIREFGVMVTYIGAKTVLHLDIVRKNGSVISKSSKPFVKTSSNFRKNVIEIILESYYGNTVDLSQELEVVNE